MFLSLSFLSRNVILIVLIIALKEKIGYYSKLDELENMAFLIDCSSQFFIVAVNFWLY